MGAMQLLNYGDPVVGYRGPEGASYTQLRGPSGRLQGPRRDQSLNYRDPVVV